MTPDTDGPGRSRRDVIAGGAAGAVAMAAALSRMPAAHAASGDPLVLGQTNAADGPTQLSFFAAGTSDVGVKLENGGPSGTGLQVLGGGIAIWGKGTHGVLGSSTWSTGVGVSGEDLTGDRFGRGVRGTALNGWGVNALSTNGQALRVEGRAVLQNRSGTVTIAYPRRQATVTTGGPPLAAYDPGPPVTPGSLAIAVLQTNLPDVYVRAVVPVVGTNQLTIYLNRSPGTASAPRSVVAAWFVIN